MLLCRTDQHLQETLPSVTAAKGGHTRLGMEKSVRYDIIRYQTVQYHNFAQFGISYAAVAKWLNAGASQIAVQP